MLSKGKLTITRDILLARRFWWSCSWSWHEVVITLPFGTVIITAILIFHERTGQIQLSLNLFCRFFRIFGWSFTIIDDNVHLSRLNYVLIDDVIGRLIIMFHLSCLVFLSFIAEIDLPCTFHQFTLLWMCLAKLTEQWRLIRMVNWCTFTPFLIISWC